MSAVVVLALLVPAAAFSLWDEQIQADLGRLEGSVDDFLVAAVDMERQAFNKDLVSICSQTWAPCEPDTPCAQDSVPIKPLETKGKCVVKCAKPSHLWARPLSPELQQPSVWSEFWGPGGQAKPDHACVATFTADFSKAVKKNKPPPSPKMVEVKTSPPPAKTTTTKETTTTTTTTPEATTKACPTLPTTTEEVEEVEEEASPSPSPDSDLAANSPVPLPPRDKDGDLGPFSVDLVFTGEAAPDVASNIALMKLASLAGVDDWHRLYVEFTQLGGRGNLLELGKENLPNIKPQNRSLPDYDFVRLVTLEGPHIAPMAAAQRIAAAGTELKDLIHPSITDAKNVQPWIPQLFPKRITAKQFCESGNKFNPTDKEACESHPNCCMFNTELKSCTAKEGIPQNAVCQDPEAEGDDNLLSFVVPNWSDGIGYTNYTPGTKPDPLRPYPITGVEFCESGNWIGYGNECECNQYPDCCSWDNASQLCRTIVGPEPNICPMSSPSPSPLASPESSPSPKVKQMAKDITAKRWCESGEWFGRKVEPKCKEYPDCCQWDDSKKLCETKIGNKICPAAMEDTAESPKPAPKCGLWFQDEFAKKKLWKHMGVMFPAPGIDGWNIHTDFKCKSGEKGLWVTTATVTITLEDGKRSYEGKIVFTKDEEMQKIVEEKGDDEFAEESPLSLAPAPHNYEVPKNQFVDRVRKAVDGLEEAMESPGLDSWLDQAKFSINKEHKKIAPDKPKVFPIGSPKASPEPEAQMDPLEYVKYGVPQGKRLLHFPPTSFSKILNKKYKPKKSPSPTAMKKDWPLMYPNTDDGRRAPFDPMAVFPNVQAWPKPEKPQPDNAQPDKAASF